MNCYFYTSKIQLLANCGRETKNICDGILKKSREGNMVTFSSWLVPAPILLWQPLGFARDPRGKFGVLSQHLQI